MLRRSLVLWSRLLVANFVLVAGCAEELDLEAPAVPPGLPGGPVEAQFDPTNPIPVLARVPTPTILAQNPDGTLNPDLVSPEACELPTLSQCLALVEGWPTNTPITLFFSDEIDLATVGDGIELYEVTATGLTPIAINTSSVVQIPRPNPGPDLSVDPTRSPTACQGEFGYTDADLVGVDVIIAPAEDQNLATPGVDLKFGTQYIVLVKSDTQGGLRDTMGRQVEASGLFFLLNDDEVPVLSDGTITSALLRSQVQNAVLASAFDGRLIETLSDAELAVLAEQTQALGLQLAPIYTAFEGVIGAARQSNVVTDRKEVIFANTWTTGGLPRPTVSFVLDETNPVVPFPSDQTLLLPNPAFGDRRVTLPSNSPIPQSLVIGLNQLDGFSLRTPPGGGLPESGPAILFSTDAPVDLDTLGAGIAMFRLDETGAPVESLALNVTSTTGTSIIVQPAQRLNPGTTYVVGVTDALKQADGSDFGTSSQFELLKTPVPLIDQEGTVASAVVPSLQCSPLLSGASNLADPDTVAALAAGLEPFRAAWQSTFTALEAANIPRTSLRLAWTYTTQSITDDVDRVKASLFAGDFDPAGALVSPGGVDIDGAAAVAGFYAQQVCAPLCERGGLPTVTPPNCDDLTAIAADPVCQTLSSGLESVELFVMAGHQLITGNPFVTGYFDPTRLSDPLDVGLPVWLITPSGTPPDDGFPVAIYQHGLTRTKEDGFLIAGSLAAAGYATIMIDLPFHGDRASDISFLVSDPVLGDAEVPCSPATMGNFVDPEDVACNPQTRTCTGGCDGVQDTQGSGLVSANFSALRDNLRQGVVDLLTLIHTMQMEGTPTGAWSQLDPTQIGFIGQSFGGITGANLLAYIENEEIDAAVLNVTGGDAISLLLGSQLSVGVYQQLNLAGVCDYNVPNDPTSGCQITQDFLTLLTLADWSMQAGDPIQTATAARDRLGLDKIMMQVVIPDAVVPNVTSEALAARYSFDTEDEQGPYQTYDCSTPLDPTPGAGHGFLFLPVCGACPAEALCTTFGAQAQAVTFIASGAQVISSQIPTLPPGLGIDCNNPCAGPQ